MNKYDTIRYIWHQQQHNVYTSGLHFLSNTTHSYAASQYYVRRCGLLLQTE